MNHHHRHWPSSLKLLLGLALAGSLTACNLDFGKDGSTSDDPAPGPAPAPAPGPAPAPSPDPAPARAALTFTGLVTDAPIANAAVIINAGGMTFHGRADANGRYSIPVSILASEVGSSVSIDATGSATQPTVRFTSRLGSFASLQTAAGSDAMLDASENFRVNVTNFSTAEAALLDEITELPADADLDTRLMAIDYTAVTDLATAISLIVDDGVALPEGVADTQALAQSPATRNRFITAQRSNGSLFSDGRTRLLANRAVVMGATAASVPAIVYSISAATAVPQDVYTFRNAERFEFNADGSGRYVGSTPYLGDHFSSNRLRWTLGPSGSIDIDFEGGGPEGTPSITNYAGNDGSSVSITCRNQIDTISVLPLGPTAVQEHTVARRRCDQSGQLPDQSYTIETTATTLFVTPAALPIAAAADVSGRSLTVPKINQSPSPNAPFSDSLAIDEDLATFNADGTGRLKLAEQDFSWTISAGGALRMSYPDGSSGEIRTVRPLVDNVVLQFGEFTLSDGSSLIGSSLRMAADGTSSVDRATFSGVFYEYGLGSDSALPSFDPTTGEPTGVSPLTKGLAYEFYPDGLAGLRFDSLQPQADGSLARVPRRSRYIDYWTVRDNGSLNYQRYDYNDGIDSLGSCGIDSTTAGCDRFRNDIYFPLASSGNRRFWLMRFNGDGTVQPASRAVFWDGAPNGDYELPRTDVAPTATVGRVPAQRRPVPAGRGRELQ